MGGRSQTQAALFLQELGNALRQFISLVCIPLLPVQIDELAHRRQMQWINGNCAFEVGDCAVDIACLLMGRRRVRLLDGRIGIELDGTIKSNFGFRRLFPDEKCCSHPGKDFGIRSELALHLCQQSITVDDRFRRSALKTDI